MTVIVSKPAINLREELASLRNQGGYQEQQFYFDGLVTNGTFDTTSGWAGVASTTDSRWYISNGTLTKGGTNGIAEQIANPFVAGKTYLVQFDVTAIPNGNVLVAIGNASHQFTSTGTQSVVLSPTTVGSSLRFYTGGAGGGGVVIDNLSVYETDGTDVVHRMPKGWVPLHVYEDGLLQREGAAHDYEVVYDGFDYYVKPAVAPSATTQTCVIGVRK